MKVNHLVLTGAVCFVLGLLMGRYSAPNPQSVPPSNALMSHSPQQTNNKTIVTPTSEKHPFDDEEIVTINERTQTQVKDLERQLARQKEEYQQQIAQFQAQIDNFPPPEDFIDDDDKTDDTPSLTTDEIAKYLSEPFLSIVDGADEDIKDLFKKINTEADDYDWAYTMEQNITDFIMLHELSDQIENVSIRCNAGICEIKGFEKEHSTWRLITLDMESQPWWRFSNTSSRTSNNQEFGNFFYMLTSTTR